MRLGPKPFVFTFSAKGAEQILVRKASIYHQSRMIFARIEPVSGRNGMVQLSGKKSKAARAPLA